MPRTTTPPKKLIAQAWVDSDELPASLQGTSWQYLMGLCWACGKDDDHTVRAHIKARYQDGPNGDPLNYLLLCEWCHKYEQPDVVCREVQLLWLRAAERYIERDLRRAEKLALMLERVGFESIDFTPEDVEYANRHSDGGSGLQKRSNFEWLLVQRAIERQGEPPCASSQAKSNR